MKNFFDNVKNDIDSYDFFALWGGGIIGICYIGIIQFVLNRGLVVAFLKDNNQEFFSNAALLMVLILSVMAYFFGLILHELGRFSFDLIGGVFACESIAELKNPPKTNINPLFSNRLAKHIFSKRVDEFDKNFEQCSDAHEASLFYMTTYLKCKGVKIPKQYSSYGLARSICIAAFINVLILLIQILTNTMQVSNFTIIAVFMVSVLVCLIMYGKAYKTYLAYLRNIYGLYRFYQNENERSATNV